MPRKKQPGELGKITVDQRRGTYRARASVRDGSGKLHTLSAHGSTEHEARTRIDDEARAVWGGLYIALDELSTVEQLANLWIADLPRRVRRGTITQQTAEMYEVKWRTILKPLLAAAPISVLEAGFVNHLLSTLADQHSPSYAKSARNIISQMSRLAVQRKALITNPVPDTDRIEGTPSEFQILTREQLLVVFDLAREWDGKNPTRRGGGRPNSQLLLDCMTIMLATSVRPGEALAIRRDDYFHKDAMTIGAGGEVVHESRAAVRITGTIIQTKSDGIHRQEHPKHRRQERGIFIPQFAQQTFRRLLADYEDNPDFLLMATRNGTPYAPRYLQKLFRGFREAYSKELVALDIDPDLFTPRSFRKTVGTALAEHTSGGLDLAQKGLGHSNPGITRKHYVKPDEQVPVEAALILDEIFGGLH